MTITLGSNPRATVFSTPSMIMLMERSAREALRPYLENGEESVGMQVAVEHLAPTPLGRRVTGRAVVTSIDGRKIEFEIQAEQNGTIVGQGTHQRAVIKLDRFIQQIPATYPSTGDAGMTEQYATGGPPDFRTLDVTCDRAVATVTLNRPAALNAVDMQMTYDLEGLVGWLNANAAEIRVVIITGKGRAFCAGDDVKEVATLDTDVARGLSLRQAELYLSFERLPQPIIAAVNGHTLGGGCVLAYSCDFRIASYSAVFGMPEIKLGWAPGYGIAQLTALIGKARTLDLCLSGRTISAHDAHAWGLVHELVSQNRLIPRAHELADQLLKLPPIALRETKRAVHADEGTVPKVAYRADTEAYMRCLQSNDAREGIEAFLQKRPARFKDA
jgi:enoyl-CoA hydratase/carnithine racemase/predicted thioesterase